jgi:hypothetical protein
MPKKKKAGRPPGSATLTDKLFVPISPRVKEQLKRRAWRHHKTLAAYCRDHLESLVK